jgi:hypothetical protein
MVLLTAEISLVLKVGFISCVLKCTFCYYAKELHTHLYVAILAPIILLTSTMLLDAISWQGGLPL